MKELKKTSVYNDGRRKHYHLFYANDEAIDPQTGQPVVGLTTTAEKHQHQVVFSAEMQRFLIMPAADGHSHEPEDYDVKFEQTKEKDSQIISDVINLVHTADEHWADSNKKADESEGFYEGSGQWSKLDKRTLESMDRAALTINLIQRHIHELIGAQIENRTDMKLAPKEGGDQRVADLLSEVVKHITQSCNYPREETRAFSDASIGGVGFLNIFVDFDDDLFGEIKIERYCRSDIGIGPCEKEDLSDAEYAYKHKMYSLPKLKQLWPDKADKIQKDFDTYLIQKSSDTPHVTYTGDQYAKSDNRIPMMVGDNKLLVDIARKEYRLVEMWRRIYRKVYVIANPNDKFYFAAHGWRASDAKAFAEMPGFLVFDRNVPQMRITKICGNVVLSDENPAVLASNKLHVVPVWSELRGNKFWGKVEGAKDPQKEVNKRRSQAIDIGNKMAAYGWFVDEGTFESSAELNKFIRNSSSPGFVAKVVDTAKIPVKVEGVKFPVELVELMKLDAEALSGMMSITPQPQGANDSGSKMLAMQKQRMSGNQFIFDNLTFAKQQICNLIVPLIQKYYDADRIFRIVSHRNQMNKSNPVMVGGEPFSGYSEAEIYELLKDKDLTKYDLAPIEQAYTPTARMGNFLILGEMMKGGVPIPPQAIIEHSDMPQADKDKIIAQIQQQQSAEMQKEQTTGNTEITKSIIGQGIIPPGVAQQMGIQDQVAKMNLEKAEVPVKPPATGGEGSGQGIPPAILEQIVSLLVQKVQEGSIPVSNNQQVQQ